MMPCEQFEKMGLAGVECLRKHQLDKLMEMDNCLLFNMYK